MERTLCPPAFAIIFIFCLTVDSDKKTAGTTSPIPPEGKMFGEMSHDFGTVPRGSQLLHRFQWRNTTDKALELVEYQRSCGCTSVSITPKTVEPGQIGQIDMLMDTKPFAGEKTVNLSLVFGPGRLVSGQFQVKAFSRGDIVYNPGHFGFGVVNEGATPTTHVDIEYAGTHDFKITEIAEQPPGLDIKIAENYRRTGGVGYRISVSLGSEVPGGDFKQTIQLRTNDPANPILPVLVDATVKSALSVVPDKLFFGTAKAGSNLSRRVTIRSALPFKVLAIEGQGNGVSVTAPESMSNVHSLVVQWHPTDLGELRAELRLRTDCPKFPVIVLPVSGIAQ